MYKIGVISDTHGLMRPQALQALQGTHHIIHAGDMGSIAVIDELQKIAPVTAVLGNVDGEDLANKFPKSNIVEFGGVGLYVIHHLGDLDLDPNAAGFAAVIYGHSHTPAQEIRRGVLFFNPGSAGPLRFQLEPSIGLLRISDNRISGEIIALNID
jgi:uncharacterized protein